ncbi:MAG: NAD(P)-dependent alcohol dehydrogenase [Candidatus Kariarchaeaceae archaeon]|jgi:NADPH:quinone reductase-like Zn-dependent oxidoreductase
MKAMIIKNFGPADVLKLTDIDKPIIEEDEILIKVHATSVNMLDIAFRSGLKSVFFLVRIVMLGIRKPRIKLLGFDFSGKIVKIGDNVTEYKIGDKVYGGARTGTLAEYTKTGKNNIAKMPLNMTYAEAGVMPVGALCALQGLRDKGEIKAGHNVLVYGASGGIGTYAVQLAKYYGCIVTGVASGKNQELVLSLGADNFIDYTKEDFTRSDQKYNIIFDTVGKSPIPRWKKALEDNGIFINSGSDSVGWIRFFLRMSGNKFRKKQLRTYAVRYNNEDLEFLAKLAEQNKIRSVIDKSYKLEEAAAAHEYYEKGHTAGKVAIIVSDFQF